MPVYQLIKKQKLPISIDEAWDFISSPKNLKVITPDYMGFDILTKDIPEKMYPGMIISYIVTPVLSIKTGWVTEITHVKDLEYFVDEQRVGPYSIWHHEHFIEEIEGGVLMTDILTYKPPFGIIGRIANSLFIKNKIDEIFTYRENKLNELFGSYPL
jgi:ligand-binding SRPBCC domain-containing protein